MIELQWDKSFIKKLKKIRKKDSDLYETIKFTLQLLSENHEHPSLRVHKLTGQLNQYHACSVTYDYRIIFKKIDPNTFYLIDIGTHDEVY